MLDSFRKEIDQIDLGMLNLLAQRLEISKKIGKYKSQNNIEIHQPQRRESLLSKIEQRGEEFGISQKLIQDIRSRIHQESLDIQSKN